MQALKDAIAKGRTLLDAFEAKIATVEKDLSDELHQILGGIHADLGDGLASAAAVPATTDNDATVGSGYVAPVEDSPAPPTQAV